MPSTLPCVMLEDLEERTFETENVSHEEDFNESEELTEDLDKVLQIYFENDIVTDAIFHIAYLEKNYK